MPKGIDSQLDCSKIAASIKHANYDFVGRYYRMPPPHSTKTPLTAKEAQLLSNAGLKVVSLWEFISGSEGRIGSLSHDTGLDEGDRGYRQALKAGQPDGTPIFYCIDEDYDVSDPTFAGPIDDYMRGVNDAFAKAAAPSPPKYTVGVYGSGAVCDWLIRKGRATKGWMAVSPKWRGHNTYTTWSIKQGDTDTSLGFDNDTDVTQGDFGAWQLPPQGMLLALWTKLTS